MFSVVFFFSLHTRVVGWSGGGGRRRGRRGRGEGDRRARLKAPRPPPPSARAAAPLVAPAPRAPLTPVAATLDDMVRWLRSRDFIVLRKDDGWRIDHHPAMDDEALVAFVNLRRARLHLAPFSRKEARIMPAAIASQVVRGRRWGRPQYHAGAGRQA